MIKFDLTGITYSSTNLKWHLTNKIQPQITKERVGKSLRPARKAVIKKYSARNGKKLFRFSWKTSGQLTQTIQKIAANIAGFGRTPPPPQ